MGALVGVRIGSSATAIFRSLTGITLVLTRLRGSDGWLCKKIKQKKQPGDLIWGRFLSG